VRCTSLRSAVRFTPPPPGSDYRHEAYPGDPAVMRHKHDCSIKTYIGHSVKETLIRSVSVCLPACPSFRPFVGPSVPSVSPSSSICPSASQSIDPSIYHNLCCCEFVLHRSYVSVCHCVLSLLIFVLICFVRLSDWVRIPFRAYFSPMHTTGQRYIYAGSHCGDVFIYGEGFPLF
jgi:hypothetical protein